MRRGGTLTDDDHRLLAECAALCAEHVLPLFTQHEPNDTRLRQALDTGHAWIRGEVRMHDAHRAAFPANAAVRDLPEPAKFAALATGQAVAVADRSLPRGSSSLWQDSAMSSTVKVSSVVGVTLLAVLALAGCISPGSGFAALDREAEAGDALPGDLPDYADDEVDAASSRLVGEHDGNALYLARSTEADRVCLLVYSNATDWVLGCGGAPEFGVSGPDGSYVIRADAPDGAPAPDQHVQIASNVFAHE